MVTGIFDVVSCPRCPCVCVLQDTEEFARVTARNEKYAALVQLQAGGGDNFSARHTQTLNNAQKNKEISATPVTTRDAGCTAAAWDIFGARACLALPFPGALANLHHGCGCVQTPLIARTQLLAQMPKWM
jgi:hypothetical protein